MTSAGGDRPSEARPAAGAGAEAAAAGAGAEAAAAGAEGRGQAAAEGRGQAGDGGRGQAGAEGDCAGGGAGRARAVLLAPGAGADRNQSALVAIDAALTADGLVVARMDFPYRKAGRRAPDRPVVLIRAVVEEAESLATAAGCPPEAIAMGGRSMGGRMCSLAVAEGLAAAALILISYPLHPPGRPDRLRTEHFPNLALPCLFVSGTKDTFGTPEELLAATVAIPGPVTHRWIEGKDHGLRGCDAAVVPVVRSFVMGLPPRD